MYIFVYFLLQVIFPQKSKANVKTNLIPQTYIKANKKYFLIGFKAFFRKESEELKYDIKNMEFLIK